MGDLFDVSQLSLAQGGLSILFGAMIGLLLGLVGGGGSILTVPILVYAIGLDVQSATATSLAIVGASALAGTIPHARAGRVNPRVAIFFGAFGVVAAFLGTWANKQVSGPLMLLLFGLLMLVVAARMWRRQPLPLEAAQVAQHLSWKAPLAGFAVGLMTGFFGVGGGFLIVPALALALGMPMAAAVGTSLVIIAINSASGIAAHFGDGGLNATVAVLFIAGGLIGGIVGGRFAGHVNEHVLSRAFAMVVAGVGIYLIARNGALFVSGLA
jgi:uncharacterized membrane protein YfcA